jgi:hypothetical protein
MWDEQRMRPPGPRPVRLRVARALAPLLLLAAASAHPAPASAQTTALTFPSIADASVRADKPSRNEGTKGHLRVGRGWATYVRFDVRVPAGSRITSARLVLHPRRRVTVRRASNDWREKLVSWRRRPRAGAVDRQLRRTGTITYQLTSRAKRAVRFGSRESGSGPQLVVRTTDDGGTVQAGGPVTGSGTPSPSSAITPVGGPPTPADQSGEGVPVAALPGWTPVFSDDFATDVPLGGFPGPLSSKWYAYPSSYRDSSGRGAYAADRTLSVSGGVLNAYVHSENGVPQVSAVLPRLPGTTGGLTSTPSGRLYGRFSVRFRADRVQGYKIAWLLWPDSKVFPRDGEIDFPEADLDGSDIAAHLHHQDATSPLQQDNYHAFGTLTSWHTATTEWLPNRVTFYLDGRRIGESTSRIPNTPMHWVLQTETNTRARPVPETAAGNVQIDWVAAWKPAGMP